MATGGGAAQRREAGGKQISDSRLNRARQHISHVPEDRGSKDPFAIHVPAVSIEGDARPCWSRHFMGVEWHVESRIVESTGSQQPQR